MENYLKSHGNCSTAVLEIKQESLRLSIYLYCEDILDRHQAVTRLL